MRKQARRRKAHAISLLLALVLLLGSVSQVFATVPDSAPTGAGMGVEAPTGEAILPEPEVVREIEENRTEFSREYLFDNGVVRAQYFYEPVHYEDAATGRLEPIDTALERVEADGDARPAFSGRTRRTSSR